MAHCATQLELARFVWWYVEAEHEVQLAAERSHVRHAASQPTQLPPLSYVPVAHEETHAPEEKATPAVQLRQLALPAPLHVWHVASHAAHAAGLAAPSRNLPLGHEATHAPSSK